MFRLALRAAARFLPASLVFGAGAGTAAATAPAPHVPPAPKGPSHLKLAAASRPLTTVVRSRKAAKTVVVQAGDTLYGIAAAECGDGSRWPGLYRSNRKTVGSDPDLIYPGERLVADCAPHAAPPPAPPTRRKDADGDFDADGPGPEHAAPAHAHAPARKAVRRAAQSARGIWGKPGVMTVARYLEAHGFNRAAAAGVAACVYGESGGNPESGTEAAGGLIGWTGTWPGPGPMITGNAARDMRAQLAAVVRYIQAYGSAADMNAYPGNPVGAAEHFSASYERPAVQYSDIHYSPWADSPQGIYDRLGPAGTGGAGPALSDPVSSVHALDPQRVDEGVDFGGHGPVRALGAGTVRYWGNPGGGWPGNGILVYELDRPAQVNGRDYRYVYVAEDFTPSVSPGQHVEAGEQIGYMSGGIETGFASATLGNAYAHDGYDGHSPTQAGQDFEDLVVPLGVPRS